MCIAGETLQMTHVCGGVDHNNILQLDIVIRGQVPEVTFSDAIQVMPYQETYLQSGPGKCY